MSACECNGTASNQTHLSWCPARPRGETFRERGCGASYKSTVMSAVATAATEWDGSMVVEMRYRDWLQLQYELFPLCRVPVADDGERQIDLCDWMTPQYRHLYARVDPKQERGYARLIASGHPTERTLAIIEW